MCGIVGLVGGDPEDLERFINCLCRVNNRGHEAVGLAARMPDEPRLLHYRHWGMVREACTEDRRTFRLFSRSVQKFKANAFVGHTRYSTIGPSDADLIQPIPARHPNFGEFVLAHNGQIVNNEEVRQACEQQGHRFRTESDSEGLGVLIAKADAPDLVSAVRQTIRNVPGAFSYLAMNQHQLVAARDRFGVKPLWFNESPGHFFVASEAAALEGETEPCEVPPGSLVCYNFRTRKWFAEQVVEPTPAYCIFEALYFSRPDQLLSRGTTSEMREALGRKLAIECPVRADIVCYVPDSGMDSALGFSMQSGVRFAPRGIVKNFYAVTGKSFIMCGQQVRMDAARMKYAVSQLVVRGRRVVIVDDTIVRGTTMPVLIGLMRKAGALEVHVRIAAAPVKYSCNKGIDIATPSELPASYMDVEQLRSHIRADSLSYLSYQSMMVVASRFQPGWCTACFNGVCPITSGSHESLAR